MTAIDDFNDRFMELLVNEMSMKVVMHDFCR